jgi:hypothetical protein
VNNIDDGGSAFPHEDLKGKHFGMTLRDYFAAKAMQRATAPNKDGCSSYVPDWDSMACECYAIADAMLKAREA